MDIPRRAPCPMNHTCLVSRMMSTFPTEGDGHFFQEIKMPAREVVESNFLLCGEHLSACSRYMSCYVEFYVMTLLNAFVKS